MSFFSKKTPPAVLAIHPDKIEVLAADSFGEMPLEEGLIQGGAITDTIRMKELMAELMASAKPNAITSKTFFVSLPHEVLYSFVKDFPAGGTEEALKEHLLREMKGHCPFSLDELSIRFQKKIQGKTATWQALGIPKKFEENLQKIFKALNFKIEDWVPESTAQLKHFPNVPSGDLALLSLEGNKVYISLFHQRLLYDSTFLPLPESKNKTNYKDFIETLLSTVDEFSTLCLIDFPDNLKKELEAALKKKTIQIFSFDSAGRDATLAGLALMI